MFVLIRKQISNPYDNKHIFRGAWDVASEISEAKAGLNEISRIWDESSKLLPMARNTIGNALKL